MKTHLILFSVLIFLSVSICKAQTTVEVRAEVGASKHLYEDNTGNKSVFGGGFGLSIGKKNKTIYYSAGFQFQKTGSEYSDVEFEAFHLSLPLTFGISGSQKISPYIQGTISPSYVSGIDISSVFMRDAVRQYRENLSRLNLSVGGNAGLVFSQDDRYIKLGVVYQRHLTSIHKEIDDFPQTIGLNISLGFYL